MNSIENESKPNLIEINGKNFEYDEDGFVNFGEIVRSFLEGRQVQYTSYFLNPLMAKKYNYPYLGEGIRIREDPVGGYHKLGIHKDDIVTFLNRMKKHDDKKEQ